MKEGAVEGTRNKEGQCRCEGGRTEVGRAVKM